LKPGRQITSNQSTPKLEHRGQASATTYKSTQKRSNLQKVNLQNAFGTVFMLRASLEEQ
jgi:hypothetical protein